MIFIPNFDVFMYSNYVQVYTYVKRARKTCQHSYTGISLHVLTNFAPNAVEDHMHYAVTYVRTYVRMQLRDVNAWSRECLDCSPVNKGHCKSWTLDSGLDRGLDRGLDYGLKFGLDSGQSLASVTLISYDAPKKPYPQYSSLHRPCKVQSASSQFSKLHDHTGK